MPYKLNINGIEVACDTPEELGAALGLLESPKALAGKNCDSGRQGDGPKRAWAAADKYAAEHGISKEEARRTLSKAKKRRLAESILKLNESTPPEQIALTHSQS